MFKNGEIEKVMAMFENPALQRALPYTGAKLIREPRDNWKSQNFYSNGAINSQFRVFLAGYSAGKAAAVD